MRAQVNDIALLLLDRPSTMRPLLHLPSGAAQGQWLPTDAVAVWCHDCLLSGHLFGPFEGCPSPRTISVPQLCHGLRLPRARP